MRLFWIQRSILILIPYVTAVFDRRDVHRTVYSSGTTTVQHPPIARQHFTKERRALCLRGGDTVTEPYSEFLELTYEWCINLGAPSALVAGVVVATLHENIRQGDLVVSKHDSSMIQLGKKVTHLLLLSAFGLETVSIFVTTVTGTVLLSKGTTTLPTLLESTAPLQFLRKDYEFEYLTARITFLQGLLNWLAALALNHIIPSGVDPVPPSVAAFNKCVAYSLFTIIVLMISFYNDHMTFYPNYFAMFRRWVSLTLRNYFRIFGGTGAAWTPRPLSFVLVPLLITSLYWGLRALIHSETNNDDTTAAALSNHQAA